MTDFIVQALAAAVIAGSLGPATPAVVEQHCVVEVVGQAEDGELIMSDPVCFAGFAEAMSYASSGELALPDQIEGSAVLVDAAVAAAVSSFSIGIHYSDYNGGGSSMTISGSACTGGYWNATGWWANRIKSSYNGCPRLRHYDSPNLGGASQTTYTAGQIDNLSALAGKVESVQYLP